LELEVLIWQLSWQMLRRQMLSWRLVILHPAAVAEWRQVLLLLCCTLQDPLRLPEHYMHKGHRKPPCITYQILRIGFSRQQIDCHLCRLQIDMTFGQFMQSCQGVYSLQNIRNLRGSDSYGLSVERTKSFPARWSATTDGLPAGASVACALAHLTSSASPEQATL